MQASQAQEGVGGDELQPLRVMSVEQSLEWVLPQGWLGAPV